MLYSRIWHIHYLLFRVKCFPRKATNEFRRFPEVDHLIVLVNNDIVTCAAYALTSSLLYNAIIMMESTYNKVTVDPQYYIQIAYIWPSNMI